MASLSVTLTFAHGVLTYLHSLLVLMYLFYLPSYSKTVDLNAYRQIGQSSNAVFIEMDLLQVGSEPVGMRCPYCQEDVMTRATYKNTTLTHIVAIFLAVFFWWLCCCIVPYVVKRWKNVEHSCPNCQRFLGVYTRKTII